MDGIVDENLCLDFRGKGTKCALLLLNIATINYMSQSYTTAVQGASMSKSPVGMGATKNPRGVYQVLCI